MKKTHLPCFLLVIFLFSSASCLKNKYKDGTYTGASQSVYTDEPFLGKAEIEIRNDTIVSLRFQIVDTLNNEVFGPDYEKHYAGNAEYIQQCRNDLKGIGIYTDRFVKEGKVDAVTGATWSYNIFTASVQAALRKAENK